MKRSYLLKSKWENVLHQGMWALLHLLKGILEPSNTLVVFNIIACEAVLRVFGNMYVLTLGTEELKDPTCRCKFV
jgi:hypothetical protein